MAVLALERPQTSPTRWPESWGPAPRWATPRTPDRPTFGPAVGQLAAHLGYPFTPAQQYVCDVALEVLPSGAFAYKEVIDLEPRRAGKSHKMRGLLSWRGLRSFATAWITAQDGDSAVSRWREISHACEALLGPAKVRKFVSTAHEVLRFANTGAEVRPFTPKETKIHGESPDWVFADEWWTVSLAQKAGLENAWRSPIAVNPMGQVWKFSAAGNGMSSALREDRARGRAAVQAGGRRGIAFFEWCAPETVGGVPLLELSDQVLVELAMANHPNAGRTLVNERGVTTTIDREMFEAEIPSSGSSRSEFIRDWLNIDQDDAAAQMFIGQAAWNDSRAGEEIPVDVRIGVGVDVDPEAREATVATAWRAPDGRALVQVVRCGAGVQWARSYVAGMPHVGAVAGINLGRTRALLDQLEQDGVTVDRLTGPTMAAAAATFHDGLVAVPADVWHDGSPALETALRNATLPARKSWMSRTGEPVTTVEACSAALWAADHLPAEAKPLPRFRIR